MRILAVDDDPLILQILSVSLTQCGYTNMTFASSGEEALRLVKTASTPFDLFLLDIMMPGMSGIELCAHIRALAPYRAVPVIVITASREHDIMERAFAAGATDFVSKPFDGLELGSRVHLARMLSESLHREKLARHEMADLAKATAVAFDEPFKVRCGPLAVELMALENELLRKPSALYAMTVFSVEIGQAQTLYRNATPPMFRHVVEAVGLSLSSVIDPERTKFAYAGKGRFVGVVNGRKRPDLDEWGAGADLALREDWSETKAAQLPVPVLNFAKVSDKKLWAGRSAAAAITGYVAKPVRKPEDTPATPPA